MVNFWLEESVPSPNKRDVKIKHSEKPGDHERMKDPMEFLSQFTAKPRNAKQLKEGLWNMSVVNCVRK